MILVIYYQLLKTLIRAVIFSLLNIKCWTTVENVHHNFPEPKGTSPSVFFCLTNSPKPKYILFTIMKENQQVYQYNRIIFCSSTNRLIVPVLAHITPGVYLSIGPTNQNRKRSQINAQSTSEWIKSKLVTSWWRVEPVMSVKCFPRDPRILQASWASWMMCAPPCTLWARAPTRPCCRSSESRSTPMNTSTAGTRASSSTTMLARSVRSFKAEFGPRQLTLSCFLTNSTPVCLSGKSFISHIRFGHKYSWIPAGGMLQFFLQTHKEQHLVYSFRCLYALFHKTGRLQHSV